MVKPGLKYSETYVMSGPTGKDIVVVRSDDTYTKEQLETLGATLRNDNPGWSGTLLVMRTDQSIERMPEPAALALYRALKQCFEPESAPDAASVSNNT